MELSFGSVEEGNRALKAATPRRVLETVKDAITALHGDYGLACVKHSINGTLIEWSVRCYHGYGSSMQ